MGGFDLWWPRIRDVAAFSVGVYLLVLKMGVDTTQEMIGAALLTGSTYDIIRRAIERNGKKRNGAENGA